MDLNRISLGLLLVVTTGCAAPRPGTANGRPAPFPPDAFITQRATLTARGRQFTLNGYLSRSQRSGLRLIVTENFGNVVADLLVGLDGTTTLIRSSGLLRPEWITNYMASDLKCVFGAARDAGCVLDAPSPDHLIIERRWYRLDLWTVEVKPGAQPTHLFEAVERGAR